jgi:hypothetical protein
MRLPVSKVDSFVAPFSSVRSRSQRKDQKQERNNNNRHYDYLFASRARTIARAWAAVSLRLDFLPPFTRAGSLKTCPHLGHFMGIG